VGIKIRKVEAKDKDAIEMKYFGAGRYNISIKSKDYKEAEKYYSQAIVLFPQMPDVHERLAGLYWHKMNKLSEVETTYIQGIEQTTGKPELMLSLINFYEKTGQIEKQKAIAKKLLELYPDNEVYKKEFGNLIK